MTQDKNQDKDKDKDKEKKTTLRDFLIKEHNLISSLGVFVALTIFSHSFLEGIFAIFLPLLFLLLAILIFFELWEQFPKNGGSIRLVFFESYLSIASVFIFIFWLSQLQALDNELPILVLSLLLYGPIMTFISVRIIKRFDIFNGVFVVGDGQKKFLRYVFAYLIIFAVFFGIYTTLYFSKEYIIKILEI